MEIQAHCIFGAVIIRPGKKEAWHSGITVRHPDGSFTDCGSAATTDMDKRVTAAIENWKGKNDGNQRTT